MTDHRDEENGAEPGLCSTEEAMLDVFGVTREEVDAVERRLRAEIRAKRRAREALARMVRVNLLPGKHGGVKP